MFVIEQIGHICVRWSYWSVLKAPSVSCDSLVVLSGKELFTKTCSIRTTDGRREEIWREGKGEGGERLAS